MVGASANRKGFIVHAQQLVHMSRATFTLPISDELKKKMKAVKGVNWSEEIRAFLEERTERLMALQKLDKMLENSKLTQKDIEELSGKIKEKIAFSHEGSENYIASEKSLGKLWSTKEEDEAWKDL